MGRWKKRSNRKGGFKSFAKRARQPTAWWRPGRVQLSTVLTAPAATAFNTTLLMRSADLISQPAAVLDRKNMIRVLRVICRIILLVTGGGNAGNVALTFAFRKGDTNAAGNSAAAIPDPRLTSAEDKREDWWYRQASAASIGAADALALKSIGSGGEPALTIDWQPKRTLEYGEGLFIAYGAQVLNGTGGGTQIDWYVEPEILISGVA